jgi:hypothetical protein
MAKIQEEVIEIKFSKLVKNNEELGKKSVITNELLSQILLVTQELVGLDIIVESTK